MCDVYDVVETHGYGTNCDISLGQSLSRIHVPSPTQEVLQQFILQPLVLAFEPEIPFLDQGHAHWINAATSMAFIQTKIAHFLRNSKGIHSPAGLSTGGDNVAMHYKLKKLAMEL